MKKLASLILALVMCLALGAPVFAGETSMTGNLATELSSQLPELKLTLPENTTIILNPYRSAVPDSAASAVGIDKGDRLQVMNGVFSISSTTSSKVHVKAVVTGAVGGNAEFSSTAIPAKASGHKVNLTLTYAYQSVKTANDALVVPAPDKATSPTNVRTISDSELTLNLDLPAAAASGKDGAVQRLNMQFGGTCSDTPTEDEGPWTESDTVSASFVFTATPVTDDPMISVVYQGKLPSTTPDFSETVVPPTDYSKSPSITKIEYYEPGATGTNIHELTKGNDNWGGAEWTSGKTIKLPSTKIPTVFEKALDNTATAAPHYKILKFTVEYQDAQSVTHETTYTFKVLVLKPLASGS